jgi:hypothetical protein
MAIQKTVVKEPSHHAFEIEQPYEELYEGLQMTGNQGLHFANQQQHQMETLPRSSIKGLDPKARELVAIRMNEKLNSEFNKKK